jgi:lipopolysaccharide cholinephosphotransferase
MRQVTDLKEIQGLALSLLFHLDEFCKEYTINYYLAYGTLLGSIRHHGFIPWDDDIDVWMMRKDYNLMIDKFPKWGKERGLFINSAQTVKKKYNRAHAQICISNTKLISNNRKNDFKEGYFIDIFPLDGTPNNSILRWLRLTHLQILKNIGTLSAYCSNNKEKITIKTRLFLAISRLLKNVDTQKIMLEYERVASKSSCSSSEYLQLFTAGNKGRNLIIKREYFDSVRQMPFETITASIPSGYDEILRKRYGDYMKLPPIEARKPHHDFILFIDD